MGNVSRPDHDHGAEPVPPFEELEARAREYEERYGPAWTHLDWDWDPVTGRASDPGSEARCAADE